MGTRARSATLFLKGYFIIECCLPKRIASHQSNGIPSVEHISLWGLNMHDNTVLMHSETLENYTVPERN